MHYRADSMWRSVRLCWPVLATMYAQTQLVTYWTSVYLMSSVLRPLLVGAHFLFAHCNTAFEKVLKLGFLLQTSHCETTHTLSLVVTLWPHDWLVWDVT